MARTQRKKKMRTINTLHYSKDEAVDRTLISTVNTYCSLPENEGLPPTSVVRNYLLRKMQEDIKKARKNIAS